MTENPAEFDVTILGQGLAGTALAWTFRWSGFRVLLIDRNDAVTASKIAAGLMTPITGQKLAMTWRYPELWRAAKSFYERVERETQDSLFRQVEMIRLFDDVHEVSAYERRLAKGAFLNLIQSSKPRVDPQMISNDFGGFAMNDGGQLDVPRFLGTSRNVFERMGDYLETSIDVAREIELLPGAVRIPRLGVTSKWIVFCQGNEGTNNPWFRDVVFKPAKGEILTVRIDEFHENRVFHRGVWLAPSGDRLFKVGSTYDWKYLNSEPTAKGRDEIISRLRQILKLPFQVVSHAAAIRPIHRNQYPVIGVHPVHPQLGFFNGLGSKGALQAPFFAQQIANWLMNRGAIDAEVDLNRKTRWTSLETNRTARDSSRSDTLVHVERKPRRALTDQAQDAVREIVQAGESVIDATAGNGHDTHFLSELVGDSGTVYAFDTQQSALDITRRRIESAGHHNVIFLHRDHGDLSNHIPTEKKGRIAAAMFNLGYLPGGDKQIVTRPESTIRGIESAARELQPGGILTVLVYTGHVGGPNEVTAVAELLPRLSGSGFVVAKIESELARGTAPILFLVKRTTKAL